MITLVSPHTAWSGLAAVAVGAAGEVVTYLGGEASEGLLVTDSLYFRFVPFLAVLLIGRAAATFRGALQCAAVVPAGLIAGAFAVAPLRGDDLLLREYPFGDVQPLLWAFAFYAAAVLLAYLTRRDGIGGDLSLALLAQGQAMPAVLALSWPDTFVRVEWGHPGQDWGGLAFAVVLAVVLRPSAVTRARTLAAMLVITAAGYAAVSASGWWWSVAAGVA